ncbi:MAG: hypothetical protein PHS69_09770, partial [Firmicutes bacterium]|nr:hypothetical protein [Bacillota bacterium]
MNTIIKERAVFAVVSILALVFVTVFGGSYPDTVGEGQAGLGEEGVAENYLRTSSFISIIKVIAGMEDAEGIFSPGWILGYGAI